MNAAITKSKRDTSGELETCILRRGKPGEEADYKTTSTAAIIYHSHQLFGWITWLARFLRAS